MRATSPPSETSNPIALHLPDAAATAALGARLAQGLAPGDAVLLIGVLGAGKSALARAAIQTLLAEDGRAEEAPSPSFTLVQTYDTARGEVWHADLHRLDGPEAVMELGLDEAFETAITFVEWPDRLGALAPPRRLEARIAIDGGGRSCTLTPRGDWRRVLDGIRP